MESVTFFDWIFILSASLFNLLIAGIFLAQKFKKDQLTKKLGKTWLALFFPLLAVFIRYLIDGKQTWVLVCFGVVFFYMLVEFLLDNIWEYDFRKSWNTHAPYIVLEYSALFSLIAIAIAIDQILGWVVSICFWILMGSLIFLYAGKKRKQTNS
jgi:hypothetical protein